MSASGSSPEEAGWARRIEQAMSLIDPVFLRSPQYSCGALNRRTGSEVVIKLETANPIRSFKGRGADLALHCAGPDARPLVCASAGNFGQGLAYAAAKRGRRIEVFAPENANAVKIARMRELGAVVTLAGGDFDEAKAHAREAAGARDAVFVEDGALPELAVGAGTIAAELGAWPHPFDEVLVPVGNGALITGIGHWFRERSPSTRVVGVVADGAPAMALSWRAGRPISTPAVDTLADGIAVREPVPSAVRETTAVVTEFLAVDDRQLVRAVRWAAEELGLLVEPAGAAGLAALLAQPRPRGRVATPLCGGNLTPGQLREWLACDPGKESRPW